MLSQSLSAHSLIDSERWFKYLTFVSESPSDDCGQNRCVEQAMLVKVDDHQHS